MRERVRQLFGSLIAISCFLFSFWSISPLHLHMAKRAGGTEPPPVVQHPVRLLAFGDVNLGRVLGKRIYAGDIDYPFVQMKQLFETADVVFVNLESQLSEQDGETQRPGSNLIFTGPKEGASTLRRSGITVVATANNHAFDYGKEALFQTLDNLDAAGLLHAGTARRSDSLYAPALFTVHGISFALFAVTDIMNTRTGWEPYVAFADSAQLFPALRAAAQTADAVIVSYHGGEEFAAAPTNRTREFAAAVMRQGAALFLGHHPHVPYGIEKTGKGYVVHSLGNFVFLQPQNDWAQRSYGLEMIIDKRDGATSVRLAAIHPIDAAFQPQFMTDSTSLTLLEKRLVTLSNIPITLSKKEKSH